MYKTISEDQMRVWYPQAYAAGDNPEELLRLWKEEGNLVAADHLADKYNWGDEEHGIFVDPDKAREICEEIGVEYEEPEEEEFDPQEATYTITGDAAEIAKVKELIDELTNQYGTPGNELGLYVALKHLTKKLVGGGKYDGNVMQMEEEGPEKLNITLELNKPEPLLYVFRKGFPKLQTELTDVHSSFSY